MPRVPPGGAISIHAPLRGRRRTYGTLNFPWYFNPRPLAGATTWTTPTRTIRDGFQSTPPCGGDSTITSKNLLMPGFQSTPPCGGDETGRALPVIVPDFNPRPLAGATNGRGRIECYHSISIHAPLRGRQGGSSAALFFLKFQSTPPCGGDARASMISARASISIHAPLRGRQAPFLLHIMLHLFQSTPPCGGDTPCIIYTGYFYDFNPRPLAGATHHNVVRPFLDYISIHAPLRGRPWTTPTRTIRDGFQSTPPCGGDHARFTYTLPNAYFNPRPLAGATLNSCKSRRGRGDFNPRPLAGATGGLQLQLSIKAISIHAPLRGRHTRPFGALTDT